MDDSMIRLAEEAIAKGERSRVLMEMLLSNLGYTLEDEIDLFAELKKCQDEYNEGIKMMALIRVEHHKKQTQNEIGVS